eukprot:2167988-Heterocapsa_arctica.AAC.1
MAMRSAAINHNGNQAAKSLAQPLCPRNAPNAVRTSAAAAARTGGRLLLRLPRPTEQTQQLRTKDSP